MLPKSKTTKHIPKCFSNLLSSILSLNNRGASLQNSPTIKKEQKEGRDYDKVTNKTFPKCVIHKRNKMSRQGNGVSLYNRGASLQNSPTIKKEHREGRDYDKLTNKTFPKCVIHKRNKMSRKGRGFGWGILL